MIPLDVASPQPSHVQTVWMHSRWVGPFMLTTGLHRVGRWHVRVCSVALPVGALTFSWRVA